MQYFNRLSVPPPAVFTSAIADNNRQWLRTLFDFNGEKLSQSFAPRNFLSLEEANVRGALDRLFQKKCAFCEARTDTRPYRFRPTSEATPVETSNVNNHLYYAWLADAWQNIYPICLSCVPEERAQLSHFPVAGRRCPLPKAEELDRFVIDATGLWPTYPPTENALLIDPCEKKDFIPFFSVQLSGVIHHKNRIAQETISHFNLNRPERVTQRAALFDDLIAQLRDLLDRGRPDDIDPLVDFGSLEFGGTWFLLLRRICMTIGSGGGPTQPLSMTRIRRFIRRLQSRADALLVFSAAIEALREADQYGVEAEFAGPIGRTGKARLRKVTLRNFKALESLEFELPESGWQFDGPTFFSPSLLILGENAAGKSSILEAVALALATDAAREELALAANDYVLNPSYMGAPKQAPPDEAVVELHFKDETVHVLSIDRGGFDIRSRIEQSLLPPVFAYGAFRHYLRRQRSYTPAKYIKNLMRSDEVLSNPEKWLLSLDPATFAMVVRQLRHVLSIEGEFEVIRRDQKQGRCYIVTALAGKSNEEQFNLTPLEVASSGFRTVLATVCDIFQGLLDERVSGKIETLAQASAVVLIDEVEAHLHPRWKMGIMRGLRLALPNVTFITTTHDPLCLRSMGDDEVMVLQRAGRDAGGPAEKVSQLPVFVERLSKLPKTSELTVEQLLTSDFFQLYSADAPEIEGRYAALGDILAKRRRGEVLRADEARTLAAFDDDINQALPVGLSEAHRLVQEAIATFLRDRRTASEARLRTLRKETKDEILAILQGVAG